MGVSAKKFAPRTKNGPKWRFMACRANYFAKEPLKAPCWANFVAGRPKRRMSGKLCLAISHTRTLLGELCLGSSGNRLAGNVTVTKWA